MRRRNERGYEHDDLRKMVALEMVDAMRRTQYCGLCGQQMFDFYRSPDGHFGIVDDMTDFRDAERGEIRCPTCGARYKLLEKIDPTGVPIKRV